MSHPSSITRPASEPAGLGSRGRDTSLTESKMNRMAFNAEDPEVDTIRAMISSPVATAEALQLEHQLQHSPLDASKFDFSKDATRQTKDELTDRLRREELEEDRSKARAEMVANLPGISDTPPRETRKEDSAKEKVHSALESTKEKAENAWETTKEKIEGLVDKTKDKSQSQGETMSKKEELAGKAKRTTEDLKEKAENIKEKIEKKGENIKEKVEKTGGNIKEKADHAKENIKEKAIDAKEKVEKKAEDIKEKFEAKSEETKNKAGGIWQSAKDKVSNIWGITKDKAGEIKDSIKGSTTIAGDDLAEHIKHTRQAEMEDEKARAREKLGATLVSREGHHHAHPASHFEPELAIKQVSTENRHVVHSTPASPTKEVAFNAEDPEVDTVRSFFQSLHTRRSG